jgi:hypothetical protein
VVVWRLQLQQLGPWVLDNSHRVGDTRTARPVRARADRRTAESEDDGRDNNGAEADIGRRSRPAKRDIEGDGGDGVGGPLRVGNSAG